MNDRIFWKLIRSARERRGVSQAELARRIGVTPLSVRGWESGRTSVDEDRMAEVAKALDATLRDLLLVELQTPAPEPLKAGRKPGPAKTTAK